MAKKTLSDHRQTVENMKVGLSRYLVTRGLAVNLEVGLPPHARRRADVLAMDFKGSKVVIIEVKSSLQDFKTDKKWQQYLEHCNQFYFAFRRKTWEKVEPLLPKDKRVGVLVLDKSHNYWHYRITAVRPSQKRVLTQEQVFSLALRLAFRGAKYRSKDDVYKGGNSR